MKLIKWAILFSCIVLPFSWMHRQQVIEHRYKLQTEEQYNRWMNTAVDDAAIVLKQSSAWIPTTDGYESSKELRIDKQQAITTFFQTLYINFDIEDDVIAQHNLNVYIPAVVVVGYNGVHFYVNEQYKTIHNDQRIQHVWKPVRPYSYTDKYGNVYTFTLDDYVTVYDSARRMWISGYQRDMKQRTDLELLQDDTQFDATRRTTIVNTIQQDLAHYINRHNEWARRNGISYVFTMPMIPNEEWHNTIDDVSVISFVQGIPIGVFTYNHYALGGSRIMNRDTWHAFIEGNIKVAYPEACSTQTYIETFSSERDAAQKGYHVKRCS